jgi:hypothetical protein
LAKTVKMFKESKLSKNADPEVWIANLKFMVQVFSNLTEEYELQMLLLEKHKGNKRSPLTIEVLKE